METVGICKLPAEPLGQQHADGRLSRAGYTHHHRDHRNSPGKPTGQSMPKSFITNWGNQGRQIKSGSDTPFDFAQGRLCPTLLTSVFRILDEMKALSSDQSSKPKVNSKALERSRRECPARTGYCQSAVDVGGWIVQGYEFPWGVVFCGERVFRIRILYS